MTKINKNETKYLKEILLNKKEKKRKEKKRKRILILRISFHFKRFNRSD
jgi:hypothetical protein